MKAYRFLAEARDEFEEQVAYFDEQVPGLGDKFIQDVEVAVRQSVDIPKAALPSRAMSARRCWVRFHSTSSTWREARRS